MKKQPHQAPAGGDFFRNFFERLPLGAARVDADGRFLRTNDRLSRMTGYGREELVCGPGLPGLAPAEDWARIQHGLQRLPEGAVHETEIGLLRKDGRAIRVLVMASPATDADGGILNSTVVFEDVGARSGGEGFAGATEDFLRQVLNSSLNAVYVHDLACGRDVFINARYTALTGYTLDDLSSMTREDFWTVFHPADAPQLAEHLQQVVHAADDEALEIEYRAKAANGSWIWCLSRQAVFTRNPDGSARQIIGTMIDITARKHAEENLRHSEARLRLANQVAKVGTFDWDLTTGVNTWSPETEALYGLEPRQFGGTQDCWEQLVFPADRASAIGLANQALQSGEPVEGEFRVQWPDGSVRWIYVRCQAVRDPSGKALRLTGINLDITRRKHAEQLLREREEALSSILNTVADAVVTLDRNGNILSANPATERMFGYSQTELVGRNARLLIPSSQHAEHDRFFELYARTGKPPVAIARRETMGKRKDGTVFPLESSATEVRDLQTFTVAVRDISERKDLEGEVLRIAEGERQRIAAELHDGICQQLVAMSCDAKMVQRLLEKQGHPLAPDLGRLAEAASKGAAQTREIARGINPVVPEGSGLTDALRVLAQAAANTHEVSCQYECPSPVFILDPVVSTHLYRIAQEAVANAVRHSGAKRIEVTLRQTGAAEICLAVKDDGGGLPPNADKGSGCGLRGMRYRAGLIGGRLAIQTGAGRGTEIICCVANQSAVEAS